MVRCACGLEAVIRTSWTNRNPGRHFYGCPTLIIPRLLRSRNELEEILAIVEEKRRELEQHLPTNVMAYKTRQELKCHQKDDMIRAMEMRSTEGLDIDDSNLLLTSIIRPTNNTHIVPEITTTQTLFSSQNNQVDNCVVKPVRKIRAPAEECIRKVIADMGEDDDSTRVSWLSTIDYVNVDGGIVTHCFRDVKKFLKNRKLEQIVVVIKSYTPNALGDLTITLKDLSGTISSTIHYKVLTEERFAKVFTIGSTFILHNVSVFSPKQSTHHYLNITKKNMVKVFHKDGGSA
uniref:Homologous recombination OB-fold protein OB-fold domain-containing protein n=1 Tax=Tanacetum cinerariifolium TaxID=118510 RepID=A0A6L2JI00_TANCI|nr:hypothetical protein [Tanacetum cinerariifolium]